RKDPLEKTKGLLINIHGTGNLFNASNGSTTPGVGLGAKLGIAFKRFSLYTQINASTLNTRRFSGEYEENELAYSEWKLIGAQYYFRSNNPSLIPYAEAALSLTYFTSPKGRNTFLTGFGGVGPSVGGGLKYFFGQQHTVAVDLGLNLTYGFYGDVDTISHPNGTNMNSFNAQLTVGFSLYPLNSLF